MRARSAETPRVKPKLRAPAETPPAPLPVINSNISDVSVETAKKPARASSQVPKPGVADRREAGRDRVVAADSVRACKTSAPCTPPADRAATPLGELMS